MQRNIIKVGFCVAYDWEMLRKSLPRIYQSADTICLSIDKKRKSWSGQFYEFNEKAFREFVNEIDISGKIKIYEDAFYMHQLSPIENDNRQRNMMATFMGEGGWHIQIDSDEYFLNFKGFTEYLKKIDPNPVPSRKPLNINVNLIPVIKKIHSGYIFVDFSKKNIENAPLATTLPIYEAARRNGHFNHVSPFLVIHETWARGEDQLLKKIQSWGHRDDFDKESYFKLWQALDMHNYRYISNFHPIQPSAWPKLGFCKGIDIDSFIENMHSSEYFSRNQTFILRNNRNFARLKSIYSKYLNR